MPTYDYRCTACSHVFEQFQSIKDNPMRTCPKCGKKSLERLIGTGGAILFKGSGFYQTDYRGESYKKAAEADKPASAPAVDSKSNTEVKPKTSETPKPAKPRKSPAKS
ncbi:MAG: FmdB family transcriptional regulator [Phycisphaerae bacterium]|nr:MAG: FmdB family transcriptional regulator [Phycisphaerae bacterium]